MCFVTAFRGENSKWEIQSSLYTVMLLASVLFGGVAI